MNPFRRKQYLFKDVEVPKRTQRRNRVRNHQVIQLLELLKATASPAGVLQDLKTFRQHQATSSELRGPNVAGPSHEEHESAMMSSDSESETSSTSTMAGNCDPTDPAETESVCGSEETEESVNTMMEQSSRDHSVCEDNSGLSERMSRTSISESDDSKPHEDNGASWLSMEQHDVELAQPLCDFLDTTKGDALLMCMAFGLRHGLSWTGLEDLFEMINCLFGKEVVKATKYFFQKYTAPGQVKITYHLYCPYCYRYLGNRQAFCESGVGCPCGQTLKDISDASSFFLSLDLGEQIKRLLQDNVFVKSLQYRFQRKKKCESAYEDIFDGEVYKALSKEGGVLSHWFNMSYTFNTDGFPVGGKSGKQTCWPIYVQINELPPNMRSKHIILAGIYVGKKDPKMSIFMHPFVEEANILSTTGITWTLGKQKIISKVIPLCACVDTPARHKILNTTAFNGHYGCSLCYIKPVQTVGGFRYPIPSSNLPERTHEEIIVDASKAHANRTLVKNKKKRRVRGVIGPTPLHNLDYFDLVKGLRPDTMHSILLGNARHLVSILHDHKGQPYYVGSEVRMEVISERLLKIQPPSSLMRNTRAFQSWQSWQAKEWRSWILFYAVPCLLHLIPIEYVSLVSVLSSAVHIILSASISQQKLDKLHVLVLRYCFLLQHYFGEEEMVVNTHLLLHLRKSIEYLGPSWTNVTFGFEGANKCLLELKKGASSIAQEIAKKYLTFQSLPVLCHKLATCDSSLDFCQKMSGRRLLKSAHRFGDLVLVGNGTLVHLDLEEQQCLSRLTFTQFKNIYSYGRFILQGVRYCASHYGRSTRTDDSYISIRGESKARIQKILRCVHADGENLAPDIYLLVREVIIDEVPIINDEFGKESPIRKVLNPGDLLAIRPEDITGQCVAMSLETGNFICDVPYGCYSDS